MIQKQSQRDILQCIGNTSLMPLRNIVPKNGSRILLKLENENPTGSMKDRMALATVEAAEADETARLTRIPVLHADPARGLIRGI